MASTHVLVATDSLNRWVEQKMKKKRSKKFSTHALTVAIFLVLSPNISFDFRQSLSTAIDGSHINSIEVALKKDAVDQSGLFKK
ncbi:hypothetical protein CUN63_16385 [Pseudomonas sp. ACM7]|nr:hypothetical protein CUN63_16385 [Pseudomonas sp. ACM7]